MPFLASAQLTETGKLLTSVKTIINTTLIPLVFALALLLFFWGMVKYIRSSGGDKEEGKKIMVWGIVALFVMSCVWGLVYFIRDELNLDSTSEGKIPTIK